MSGDYLDPADVRPVDRCPDPTGCAIRCQGMCGQEPPAAPTTVDLRMLHLCGQQLLAAREAIDATLLTLSVALGEGEPHPAELSACDTEEHCEHPRDRRQVLAVIGSTDGAEWRCRDCGYIHNR